MKKPVRIEASAEQMFVRIPLPPEVVATVRKHADKAGELVTMGQTALEMVSGANAIIRKLFEASEEAVADLERDVGRVRKAVDGRRRRRPRARARS